MKCLVIFWPPQSSVFSQTNWYRAMSRYEVSGSSQLTFLTGGYKQTLLTFLLTRGSFSSPSPANTPCVLLDSIGLPWEVSVVLLLTHFRTQHILNIIHIYIIYHILLFMYIYNIYISYISPLLQYLSNS